MPKSRQPQPKDANDPAELAEVRAEVAHALRSQPPDLARLLAVLDRVDALLDKARADLVAIVREIQPEPGSAGFRCGGRDILPG